MTAREFMLAFRGYRMPHFRIVQRRKRWFALSGVLIVLSLVGLFVRGLNFSIDFVGGALIQYENAADVSVEEVRTCSPRSPTTGRTPRSRSSAGTRFDPDDRAHRSHGDPAHPARRRLAEQAGVDPADVSTQVVGPTWGAEISRKAIVGLVVVLVAIAIYIALRFEWKMAVGAMVALVHDVLITAGVYALIGREVTPETVIAILTILGFSLYDTVVIYDKIKENTESAAVMARDTYEGVANLSLNQVLMRSVNTSLVVLLPILSLLLFGGETLKDFAFAMFIGVAIGAYSSIFIAAPILVILKEREPQYRQPGPAWRAGPGERRRRPVPAAAAAPVVAAASGATEGEPAAVGVPLVPANRAPSPPAPGAEEAARQAQAEVTAVQIEQIDELIRDVPDFPEPGIVFKDITPVLADELAFSTIIDLIVVHFGRGNVDKVVGIEARGFILGAPVAYHFGAGFVPGPQEGQAALHTETDEYALEYGTATLEIHRDAVTPGERVLVVDDVLATGGTAKAAADLVERIGGKVVGIASLIELEFLHGRDKLEGYDLFTLIRY